MIDKIREAVEHIFSSAPRTRKVQELKEELVGNLEAKYRDLIEIGRAPEEAYNMVIASIGDIDELIDSIVATNPLDYRGVEAERKKTALVVSGAIGMYILAIVISVIMEALFRRNGSFIAGISFILIAGVATCILVYHFMSKPKYVKADATIVEEFKEWTQESGYKKQIYRSVISIMWSFIVVIYLMISFAWGIWYCSWIIFIMGAVIERIIKLVFDLYEMR